MRPNETCAHCSPARRDKPVRSRWELGLRRCEKARSWAGNSSAFHSSLRESSGMASSSAGGGTAKCFDAIAVGVDREGGVVAGAVFAADARAAIVAAAGAQRGGVECLYGLLVRRVEAEMQAGLRVGRHRRFGRRDPQRDAVAAIAQEGRGVPQAFVAERRERGIVEAFGARHIAHADRDMVEHWMSPWFAYYITG